MMDLVTQFRNSYIILRGDKNCPWSYKTGVREMMDGDILSKLVHNSSWRPELSLVVGRRNIG